MSYPTVTLPGAVPAALFQTDDKGGFAYANPACLRLLGRPMDELMGDGWLNCVRLKDRARVLESWQQAVTSRSPYAEDFCAVHANDRLTWVRMTADPCCHPDGSFAGHAGFFIDISEQRRLSMFLQEAEQRHEQSAHELQRFAFSASHDLQESLRVIGTFSELLIRSLPAEPANETQVFLGHIQTGVEQMRTLVEGLLDYSRAIHPGPWDTHMVPLTVPLSLATEALKPRIESTGAIITWDNLPKAQVNQSRFVQLFHELIENSLIYSAQPPRIHISAEQHDEEWVISVRDNGVGIDPDYQQQIFQVFQRLHSRSESHGHGIGLAVCKAIVERHGGVMWVDSEPGQGATFRFTLPAR
ncbi:MAG: PAS domain-containing protein [Bryobacterales bacterium]|nr:PAS domain-containing protein [Bryobacterales bacterium]